jgi:hypothetical protein
MDTFKSAAAGIFEIGGIIIRAEGEFGRSIQDFSTSFCRKLSDGVHPGAILCPEGDDVFIIINKY